MLAHASKVSGATLGVALWLAATMSAGAQSGACTLVPDDRNPSEKIMRCGDDLVVRAAPGTRYHPVDQKNNETPKTLQLDSGALMIEFRATDAQKDFQILTPHAIAAVRGTKWVVEVVPSRSSTLVISGEVAVRHLRADDAVALGPGQGVDVSPGTRRLVVKRWPSKRVQVLLARFGE
jgi:FecR protein